MKNTVSIGVALATGEAPDDPEDTLLIALTHAELALAVAGLACLTKSNPQTLGAVARLCEKTQEIGFAQGFFTEPVCEWDEF